MHKQTRRYERIKIALLLAAVANLGFLSYTVYLTNWS